MPDRQLRHPDEDLLRQRLCLGQSLWWLLLQPCDTTAATCEQQCLATHLTGDVACSACIGTIATCMATAGCQEPDCTSGTDTNTNTNTDTNTGTGSCSKATACCATLASAAGVQAQALAAACAQVTAGGETACATFMTQVQTAGYCL